MKEKLNGASFDDPFPPQSSNGTATSQRTKANGSPKARPAEGDTAQSERPQATRPTNRSRSNAPDRERKAPTTEGQTPAQVLSGRVTAFVGKYPLQTIGGLLSLLAVIVLFKTFYQGKNWKAKRMAEEAYYVANQYARNNGTNLQPYLSQAFRREVRQLPGLLPLSMQTATRGGTVTGAASLSLREITPDSVVVELSIVFENGREEKRYQPLVYEKEQWRLGLAYGR